MSLRLTLISNGATEATRRARFPTDETLEPDALARAAALAGSLGRVDKAWTSPALRAVETAKALGLDASIESLLSDIDLGRWAGQSLADVEAADAFGLSRWQDDPAAAPHGGESVENLLERIAHWLDGLGDAGRIVAVTHAAVIRAVTVLVLEANARSFWRIDVGPLCFSRFQFHRGRWSLRCLNVEPGGPSP